MLSLIFTMEVSKTVSVQMIQHCCSIVKCNGHLLLCFKEVNFNDHQTGAHTGNIQPMTIKQEHTRKHTTHDCQTGAHTGNIQPMTVKQEHTRKHTTHDCQTGAHTGNIQPMTIK